MKPFPECVCWLCTLAAKRYHLYPQKGRIAIGADADLAILNPNQVWTVNDEKLKQMIKWSPYHGMQVTGKITSTIVGGTEVYNGTEIIAEKGSGSFVAPNRKVD